LVFLPSRRQRSGVAGDAEVEADDTTAEGYRLEAWVTQQRYEASNGALDPDVSPDSTESRVGMADRKTELEARTGLTSTPFSLLERATRDQRISNP
jgi:hypothetical protein